jgi:hypothetical protein
VHDTETKFLPKEDSLKRHSDFNQTYSEKFEIKPVSLVKRMRVRENIF